MGLVHKLIEQFRSMRLNRSIRKGHVLRGRQPGRPGEGGSVASTTRLEGHISARVYRAATASWEDLGEIAKPELERGIP